MGEEEEARRKVVDGEEVDDDKGKQWGAWMIVFNSFAKWICAALKYARARAKKRDTTSYEARLFAFFVFISALRMSLDTGGMKESVNWKGASWMLIQTMA